MATGTFKSFNNAHKNAQESPNIFKPRIHCAVSTGTNIAKTCSPCTL